MAFDARPSSITVVFYDLHPDEMWAPGHVCYDWCVKVSKQLEINTKATAPSKGVSMSRWNHRGTGALAAGISAHGSRTGPESYGLLLNSSVHYSSWVHGGTAGKGTGYIYSTAGHDLAKQIDRFLASERTPNLRLRNKKGHFMSLHGNGLWMTLPLGTSDKATKKYHMRVRGQLPNPYLVRGWNITNAQHGGSLGRFREHVGFLQPM